MKRMTEEWLERETNAMLKAAGRSPVGTNRAFRDAVRTRLARLRRTSEAACCVTGGCACTEGDPCDCCKARRTHPVLRAQAD